MIVVTGGAGFIGSCIVARLNSSGREDLIIVDHLEKGDIKKNNLAQKVYIDYFDKSRFLELVLKRELSAEVDTIIHMGACSSTTLEDADYYEKNNFEYTRQLAEYCFDRNIRFIYASSAATYGDGKLGYDDADDMTRKLEPLNYYGYSKQKFDEWVLDKGQIGHVVGLKFFNVFGPNEYHKEGMRSVVAKAYPRVANEGKISLFKSYKPEYGDGEQKRDFIYVKDAVDVVMHFVNNSSITGIYNVGTGNARSWNDLAMALFMAVGKEPHIEYMDMPKSLRPRYQYFTQARVTKLRESGFQEGFTSLEDSIKDYVTYLKDQRYL